MTSPLKIRAEDDLPEPEDLGAPYITDLRGRELFKDFTDPELNMIVDSSKLCALKANQRLSPTRRGINHVYLILKGYVAIWIGSCFNPQKETFLAWRGPDQVIGEMRPLDAEPSPARITTCDPCKFLDIRTDTFMDLAERNPLIYRNIANLLLKKMAFERHRAEVIQTSGSKRRVAQTLIHLAEDRCDSAQLSLSNKVRIPGVIHQNELAGYTGVTRSQVNRDLNGLKIAQMISYRSSKSGISQIAILDKEGLSTVVRTAIRRRKMKSAKKPGTPPFSKDSKDSLLVL